MPRESAELRKLIEPAVTSLGFELVGVEFIRGRTSVLRVYIDSEDGITVDDCKSVSYQVSGLLDVEDPIRGQYSLEVSSPGLDRPLFRAHDFERFAGHEVTMRLLVPVEGRRKFKAVIAGVEGEAIHLTSSETDEEWQISLDNIEKANLVPEL